MLTNKLQEKIFKLFEDEIVFHDDLNTEGLSILLKALISYKLTIGMDYIFTKDSEDYPLDIHMLNNGPFEYDISESGVFNCLVIGGKAINGILNESISAFINMQFDSPAAYEVIINEESRIVQLRGNGGKYPPNVFYLLASIMPKLIPWYFPKENLSKIEDIIRAFFKKDTGVINSYFETLVIENNVLAEVNKQTLELLGEKTIETKEGDLERELVIRRDSLDMLVREIQATNLKIERILDEKRILTFKKEQYENPIKEIVEFLENTNEDINLIEVEDNGWITLEIITNLEEVSIEQYEDCIANAKHSEYLSIFGEDGSLFDSENLRLFYKKIFIDKEFKLKAKTKIKMNLFSKELKAMEVIPGANYIEHPHLRGSLGCFGNASATIVEYLSEMRYTEAISQILYAASQSTLSDLVANRSLINNLCNPTIKPILLPNGEYANVAESIKYIKENNEEETE